MSDNDVLKVLRFLHNRFAACSKADREEIERIIEAGDVTLKDVIDRYIHAVRNA